MCGLHQIKTKWKKKKKQQNYRALENGEISHEGSDAQFLFEIRASFWESLLCADEAPTPQFSTLPRHRGQSGLQQLLCEDGPLRDRCMCVCVLAFKWNKPQTSTIGNWGSIRDAKTRRKPINLGSRLKVSPTDNLLGLYLVLVSGREMSTPFRV